MEIDTLIFSGASTRGVIFLGCLNYLIEYNLIDKYFKNIKKIYCVSASYMFVLSVLLLKYDYKKIQKQEVKKVLIKEQEKTQYGPPMFGKVLADKAPNGTSRAPKFNYKSIED